MNKRSRPSRQSESEDIRGSTTRLALIEAAEELIGARGLEGWSLRLLGQAIGSSNTNVVAYHFGDRDGLVRAIIRHRIPALEASRAKLWTEVCLNGRKQKLSDVANVIWRPFFQQVNANGIHGYAALMGSLHRFNRVDLRAELDVDFPITNQVLTHIRTLLPAMSDAEFEHRMETTSVMCFSTMVAIDHRSLDPGKAEARFSDTIRMITGALQAPVK